jgi:hypothetical protein
MNDEYEKPKKSKTGVVSNKKINVSTMLLTTEYGKFLKVCAIEERSMAQMIRRLVRGKIMQAQDKGLID